MASRATQILLSLIVCSGGRTYQEVVSYRGWEAFSSHMCGSAFSSPERLSGSWERASGNVAFATV
jgi:hypothetical protein